MRAGAAAIAAACGTCPCRRCQAAAARPRFRTHQAWLAHHREVKDAAAAGRLLAELAAPPLYGVLPVQWLAMRAPAAARRGSPQRPRVDLAA